MITYANATSIMKHYSGDEIGTSFTLFPMVLEKGKISKSVFSVQVFKYNRPVKSSVLPNRPIQSSV